MCADYEFALMFSYTFIKINKQNLTKKEINKNRQIANSGNSFSYLNKVYLPVRLLGKVLIYNICEVNSMSFTI